VYGFLKYGRIEKAIPLANKASAIAVSNPETYVLTEQDVQKL
jgi:fructose-1-phosphate kinase PfkB-like protein